LLDSQLAARSSAIFLKFPIWQKPDQVPRVLRIAAQFAGQLTNLSEIGRSVGLDHKTADRYVRVLEQLYLIQRVQPGFRNELSRLERVASAAGSAFMQGIVLSWRSNTLVRRQSSCHTLIGVMGLMDA
jgi:hypothetical protein